MFKSPKSLGAKRFFLFILTFLVLTDLAILLDIPILRQVLGFTFFSVIPGLLILYTLRVNKLGLLGRFVLSIGLSISFLMLFGLIINSVYPLFGYTTPLSTNSLIASFSAITLVLVAIAFFRSQTISFQVLSDFELNVEEKAFLIVPALFILLSILGMRLMNVADNNIMLMTLIFLIIAYAIFIAVKQSQVSDRSYPPIIFLTSISLVLLLGLRSNHIIGSDAHTEYYLFQLTLANGRWQVLMNSSLDTCLGISLLPTIYQSLLNIDSEYLFKTLYPFLFSISPLVVYIISKKYIGGFYAFLASLFFMSQHTFLWTAHSTRTTLAVLFFALSVMVLFQDGLSGVNKKLLFIVFSASCIVSHYSTTYIFLFILLLTWFGMWIMSRIIRSRGKPTISGSSSLGNPLSSSNHSFEEQSVSLVVTKWPKSHITIGLVTIFFVMLFIWYNQMTEVSFRSGVMFVSTIWQSLTEFFMLEARSGGAAQLFGVGLGVQSIPRIIEIFLSWLVIVFIAIGILATLVKYRHTVDLPKMGKELPGFLYKSQKLDPEFFIISLSCSLILLISVVFPAISTGYDLFRISLQMMAVLSLFFVIGGIMVARLLRLPWACLIILSVLIPYFMTTTGTMYQLFEVPQAISLNSEGEEYDTLFVHDQESHAARWLADHNDEQVEIYADWYGSARLVSQGKIPSSIYAESFIENKEPIDIGYYYLRYSGVINGKLMDRNYQWHDIAEYRSEFDAMNLIYTNGGSEIYK